MKTTNARDYYIKTPAGKTGKAPSVRDIAAKFDLAKNTVQNHKTREDWVTQRKAYWDKVNAKTIEKEVETIAEMNVRHLREYRLIQAKGIETLGNMKIKTPRDAVYAVDTGIRGERIIHGEPTESVIADVIIRIRKPEIEE